MNELKIDHSLYLYVFHKIYNSLVTLQNITNSIRNEEYFLKQNSEKLNRIQNDIKELNSSIFQIMVQIINEKDNNNFEIPNLRINFNVEKHNRIYRDISSLRINIETKSFTLSELQKKTESAIY